MRNRTMRTDLPTPVWERFADEAHAAGRTPAAHLRHLMVARDKRKYMIEQVSEASDTETGDTE